MARRSNGLPAVHETKVFTPQVIALARWLGWKVAHFRPAQVKCKLCHGRGCRRCKGSGLSWRTAVSGDGEGFYDLVMGHKAQRRLIFAELKSETGARKQKQAEWADLAIALADRVEYYLWRPSDYDEIERILRGK